MDRSTSSANSIEEYDVVILGTGEGSKYLAWTLGKQGGRVAVVERKYIGGSCPNIACLLQERHSQRPKSLLMSVAAKRSEC